MPWLGKELVPSLERALDQEQSVVLLVPWSELELATQWGEEKAQVLQSVALQERPRVPSLVRELVAQREPSLVLVTVVPQEPWLGMEWVA